VHLDFLMMPAKLHPYFVIANPESWWDDIGSISAYHADFRPLIWLCSTTLCSCWCIDFVFLQ
jgi:hypothetical protein